MKFPAQRQDLVKQTRSLQAEQGFRDDLHKERYLETSRPSLSPRFLWKQAYRSLRWLHNGRCYAENDYRMPPGA